MGAKKNLILFIINGPTSYSLQSYLIRRVVDRGDKAAIFFTGSNQAYFRKIAHNANLMNIEAFSLDSECSSGPPFFAKLLDFRLSFRTLLFLALAVLMARLKKTIVYRKIYSKRLSCVMSLLTRLEVDLVVCSEDGISSDLIAISAAIALKIPVIDVPFGNGTQFEFNFDLKQKHVNGELIMPSKYELFILRNFLPAWVKNDLYAGAIMYPIEIIFAYESLGVTLRNAWIIHGGMSDILCVENRVGMAQYISEGIESDKLRLTGSPYCDMMFDSVCQEPTSASALLKPGKIDPTITRILVSWPPSYHEVYPGKNEFQTYDEMTTFFFKHIKNIENVELIVSLHPSSNESVRGLLQDLNIAITSEDLIGLMPRCDVYITYFSSTIRWALAAGKLVVNYDIYRLGLQTYSSAPGFFTGESFIQFSNLLNRVLSSNTEFYKISLEQHADAKNWGVIDGAASDRILQILDELVDG